MKKIKLVFIFFLFFFVSITCVSASTKTYTRTKTKPLVPDDVLVTEKNIDAILKTPAVSEKEKIYEYAEIYSNDQEEYLYQKLMNYINNSNIDAVIITTRDLNDKILDNYAYDFYDYNNFKKEGVVFTIYLGSTEPKIFMGNIIY